MGVTRRLIGTESLVPGDHVSAFLKTTGDFKGLITSYVKSGLARNEKVFIILHDHTRNQLLDFLMEDGVDAKPFLAKGQLIIVPGREAILQNGVFNTKDWLERLSFEINKACNEGYSALRGAGEMAWISSGGDSLDPMMEYEMELNNLSCRDKLIALCIYNESGYSKETLSRALKIHPTVSNGAQFFSNMYYVPEHISAETFPDSLFDLYMSNLIALKKCEAEAISNEDRIRSLSIIINQLKFAEEEYETKIKELRTILKGKGEFISIVAHELRTPLSAIIGYSEMLLGGSFGEIPEEIIKPIRLIIEQAKSLNAIVDDLVVLAQKEQGTISVSLQPISLKEIVESVIEPYLVTGCGKKVNIEQEVQAVVVIGDPNRLQQVLRNLINNAIRHSGDEVNIKISAGQSGDEGFVSVADNGRGIPQAEIALIFDKFYKVLDGQRKSSEGLGLGLAIVKELVTRMGGTISVESEVGKGSTFTIKLPLAKIE